MNPTFTTLENFGHSLQAQLHEVMPRSADEIHEAFEGLIYGFTEEETRVMKEES